MEKQGSNSFMSPRCEILEEGANLSGFENTNTDRPQHDFKVLDPASFPRAGVSYIHIKSPSDEGGGV